LIKAEGLISEVIVVCLDWSPVSFLIEVVIRGLLSVRGAFIELLIEGLVEALFILLLVEIVKVHWLALKIP